MNLLRDFLQKYKAGDKALSRWCILQKRLHKRRHVGFNEREIRWCSVGVNIGYEIDGKGKDFARPVLVLKKVSREQFIGLPITSTHKDLPGYYEYKGDSLLFEQVRVFNSRRLLNRKGVIGKQHFQEIQNAFLNYMSPHKRGPDA